MADHTETPDGAPSPMCNSGGLRVTLLKKENWTLAPMSKANEHASVRRACPADYLHILSRSCYCKASDDLLIE